MLPPSPFRRADARDWGISDHDWRLLLAAGEVRMMLPDVYADARLPDTLDLRIAAVAMALPADVVVARDLGRFLPRPQALAAIDAMLHAGLVTQDQMWDQVDRWRRRRGVRQLAEMIHLSEPACESAGESRMRLRVVDAGLPRPQVQIPVLDDDGYARYRLDAGYEERRVGFEFDGEEHHPPERAAADEARRAWITGRGWRLAVFRGDDVYGTTRAVELAVRRLLDGT